MSGHTIDGETNRDTDQVGGRPTTDGNVIMVTVDSLRADHCGFMGYDRDTTPTLDRLAEKSVVFENAIAPGPRTPSSMPAVFTGQFNTPAEFEYGDWQHRYGRISEHLRRSETLPEQMQDAGFTTVGITVNPWTQNTDFDTGFDRFIEVTGEDVTADGKRGSPLLSAIDRLFKYTPLGDKYQWHTDKDWFVQWPHYYDRIQQVLADISEPYFLWVFLLDTHQPYLTPREYRTDSNILDMYYANYRERSTDGKLPERVETRLHAAYRDTIRSVDGFVEQLLSDIDGNPSLVFHSDHGDAFYEHGTYGHHSELYEENIHVPLLVYDGETTGRVSGPVSLRTLPDIVCRLGTDVPLNPESWTSEFVMSVTEGISKLALRSNHWKYIAGDEEEVYNLAADPEETHDLSGEHQEVTAAFRQLLRLNRQHIDEVATIVETAAAFDEPVPKQRGSQT